MSNRVPTQSIPRCDYEPLPYDGLAKDEVIRLRSAYCNPAIFHYYDEPLMIVDGHMQYLFDETGKQYLDLFAGIATVSCGHCHPEIIKRTTEQLERLQHASTIYLNPLFPEFAKRIADTLPEGLDSVYFVNSGSEANDLAILMARLHTKNYDVLALQNCYHGGASTTTMGLTSHYTWKHDVPQGFGVHHVACPDAYRSDYQGTAEQIAEKSAEQIHQVIRFQTPGKVAAYIAEPIQGVGGVTSGAANYLPRTYEIIRKHGGLCISDEVQTGFGRTGDAFWGFENSEVVPDIVTMAKGIGNGIPLAAVVTRREIADSLAKKIHFNTFGGNPVSMAQGLAVLEVIKDEHLQQNAEHVGAYFHGGLLELMEAHPLIGDVRGRGLMLGFELVKDRGSKEPAKDETARFLNKTRESGVLVGKGGLFGNVIRIKPPLCLTKADADFALNVFDRVFKSL